jgi:transketolase
MAEGSVWEAFDVAGYYKLNNLINIIDMNRLGQRGPTKIEWHGDIYAERAEAFGWEAIQIDGLDVEAVNAAYAQAVASTEKPVCIIAKTQKGAGISFIADKEGWHGKALPPADAEKALAELGNPAGDIRIQVQAPRSGEPANLGEKTTYAPPTYELGSKVATREAYGDALVALGKARPNVIALDGEVSNSTFAERFKKAFPERFIETFIAEQQLLSAAVGLQRLDKIPFCSSFAAFFSRAYDQIRMAAISRANIRIAGSHAGVSIGEDGPSQMALEDIAMFRAVYGSTVLYPSCATTTGHLIGQMASREGVCYMRTTREKTPVLYGADESFPIGGSKTLKSSANDKAAIIAAGITLHEALKAYDLLQAAGVSVRVIDLYSVKPIDAATIEKAAAECKNLLVVEDHWQEGGLADAVLEVFDGKPAPAVTRMGVQGMPLSGPPAAMLKAAKIDAEAIVAAVNALY